MKEWITQNWCELFVRFALMFFCLTLWLKGFIYWGMGFLVLAWLMDGGLSRFSSLIREPLVLGILVFCGVWVFGLLWSDFAVIFPGKWMRYFILLVFIPLFSLLNRERLPWATWPLICGYLSMVMLGSYQWAAQEMQGIPLLSMSYLSFSAVLGIGVIAAVFLGWEASSSGEKALSVLLWLVVLGLLFLQFHQQGRWLLLTTLVTLLFMAVLRYQVEVKKLMGSLVIIFGIVTIFIANNDVFQERLWAIGENITSFQNGNYETSIGYRFAMWDVGLHGIAEHPFLGHGSGMAEKYFNDSIETYKQGIYRNLTKFMETRHFHNELIEVGMNLGLLGMLAFVYLLWSWWQMFRRYQMALLGSAIVGFIFMSGLTDTFLLYSKAPPFLLATTAIFACWHKYGGIDLNARNNSYSSGISRTVG